MVLAKPGGCQAVKAVGKDLGVVAGQPLLDLFTHFDGIAKDVRTRRNSISLWSCSMRRVVVTGNFVLDFRLECPA